MLGRTVGSNQAEHESQESRYDIAMRVGNSLVQRDEPMGEEGAASPKGAYKEVPRPSRRLGLATTKSTLTVSFI